MLDGDWTVEVSETEVGVGYGCVIPAAPPAAVNLDGPVASDSGAATGRAPTVDTQAGTKEGYGYAPDEAGCPTPPPPVLGQHVAFFPVLDGVRADWNGWGVTVASGGAVANLYGTWARFEAAGSYPLRSVDAALDELRDPKMFVGDNVRRLDAPMPEIAASEAPAPPTVGVTSPPPMPPSLASDPAVMPVPEPCTADGCVPPPAPVQEVITIKGVTRGLTTTTVWTGDGAQAKERGAYRTYLVPAYRFVGKWASHDAADRWETSVLALHPDAIAPPPAPEAVGPDNVTSGETKVRDEGSEGGVR